MSTCIFILCVVLVAAMQSGARADAATALPASSCPTCPTCPASCPACPTLPPPRPCHLPSYTRIPVGCYNYHAAAATWPAAKETCEREGGHLVILNGEEEYRAIETMHNDHMERVTGETSGWNLWVGIRESETSDGVFHSVLGEPLNVTGFSRWDPGYPRGHNTLGDFVSLYAGSGGYLDCPVSWQYKLPFVCEQQRC